MRKLLYRNIKIHWSALHRWQLDWKQEKVKKRFAQSQACCAYIVDYSKSSRLFHDFRLKNILQSEKAQEISVFSMFDLPQTITKHNRTLWALAYCTTILLTVTSSIPAL